jgi:hypothetical protein
MFLVVNSNGQSDKNWSSNIKQIRANADQKVILILSRSWEVNPVVKVY